MHKGRTGEILFKQRAEALNYSVEDVSNNPDYWHKDIDFILTSPTTGAVKTFEVKWDGCISRTGNLYLEETNVHSKGGIGWFNFCQADYIAYGDAANKVFYIIPREELKKRAKEVPYRSAKCGGDSIGQLLALKDIQDLYQIL